MASIMCGFPTIKFSFKLSNCVVVFLVINSISYVHSNVEQRTNKRCEEICNEDGLVLAQSHKPDCQRGCRYFNIEFLTNNAGSLNLGEVNEQCKNSCREAYKEKMKKEACCTGCSQMFDIQEKAPSIEGWLVYLGASDRGMVVLQPNIDLQGDNEWVMLDSVFRTQREFSENELNANPFKLTETKTRTMPLNRNGLLPVRIHNSQLFCIHWMWLLPPLMLLLALIWIQYGPTIKNVFIFEEDSDDEEHIIIQRAPEVKKTIDNFVVTFDSFFYPSATSSDYVMPEPPPKYSDYEKYPLFSGKDASTIDT